MSTLMAHTATGKMVQLEDLKAIATPEPTATWHPIGHHEMAVAVKRWTTDTLANRYSFESEQYAVAHGGKQMFGLITLKNGNQDMGLALGFRNSIDKSLGAAFAGGGQVFVCDNLALNGDIVVMRKHTVYIWEDLEQLALQAIGRLADNFTGMIEHAEVLKQITYTDDQAYERVGLLYGKGVLTPRQLPKVLKEWHQPKHDAFEPRNAWSLYNAATEAMKTTPPDQALERFTRLTKIFEGQEVAA